jgi:division protein CdvB (Snf7/Vps24/ESCRT-III family)
MSVGLARVLYEAMRLRNWLGYVVEKMRERDELLFEKVLQAEIERDRARAARFASEVAELRKSLGTVLAYKKVLERVVARLEAKAWRGSGEVVETYLSVLRYVARAVWQLAPMSLELLSVLDELGVPEEPPRSLVVQLLEEASAEAKRELEYMLPELPSTMPVPARGEAHA